MSKTTGDRLADKTVLVSGVAGDIGRALAAACAAQGAKVACTDIDVPGLTTSVESLGLDPDRVLTVGADLTDFDQCEQLTRSVLDWSGGIDVLLANAGGSRGVRIPFLELTPETWQRMVDRNLTSAFHLGLTVARRMADADGGSIVYTSSQLGIVAERHASPYCTSKAGIIHLVKAMAVDLAPHGIRVNSVAPGTTLTSATEEYFARPEVAARHEHFIPARRHARPEEIAGAAVYLASDEASYTTGTTIVVDGGYTIV